jgi:hypothetical protein
MTQQPLLHLQPQGWGILHPGPALTATGVGGGVRDEGGGGPRAVFRLSIHYAPCFYHIHTLYLRHHNPTPYNFHAKHTHSRPYEAVHFFPTRRPCGCLETIGTRERYEVL